MQTGNALREGLMKVDAALVRYDRDKWSQGPWMIEVAGREWAVATNGHALVAVHRELVDGDCLPIPDPAARVAEKWIPFTPSAPVSLSAGELKKFAGVGVSVEVCETCQNKRFIDCEECDGDGVKDCRCWECGETHDATCKKCNGDGERKCADCQGDVDARPVGLIGLVLDRQYLHSILGAVMPDDAAKILTSVEPVSKTASDNLIVFRAEDSRWMAVLMPMREKRPVATFEPVAATA